MGGNEVRVRGFEGLEEGGGQMEDFGCCRHFSFPFYALAVFNEISLYASWCAAHKVFLTEIYCICIHKKIMISKNVKVNILREKGGNC